MNALIRDILIAIFLTATAIEFVEASGCPEGSSPCYSSDSCRNGLICCSGACVTPALNCPPSSVRCDSSSNHTCLNGGICCQANGQSRSSACECFGGFTGAYCEQRRRRPSFAETTSKDQISTARESREQAPSRSLVFADEFDDPVNIPPTSTNKQQNNSKDYTSRYSFAEITAADEISTRRGSIEQLPAMSIGLTTLVAVIAVGVLLCIASLFIARLIFKRKYGSAATGIKSGNTDAEKKYQNLKTSRLNEDGEIADHYDTIDLYDKGYDTINEYSLEDPNYEGILDNEYLEVIAEADDGNLNEADDNDYAATEDHQSRQTEANVAYQALIVQETPRKNETVDAA